MFLLQAFVFNQGLGHLNLLAFRSILYIIYNLSNIGLIELIFDFILYFGFIKLEFYKFLLYICQDVYFNQHFC